MRTFGLIGYPLSHSFSKNFFTEKFARESVSDAEYLNFPIPSIEALPGLLAAHPALQGFNITIPYKEKVIGYLDQPDEVVKKIGACNCIRIREGKLQGFNTDVAGFERSLDEHLQPHHRKALVLGTGGASKAVEYVLQKKGIEYQMVSRTGAGAGTLSYSDLDEDVVQSHPLIINTTPLGMHPNVDGYPEMTYEGVGAGHYLFDLVYNPARTRFLEIGEQRGAVIQNGLPMLVIQAEESWRIWNETAVGRNG